MEKTGTGEHISASRRNETKDLQLGVTIRDMGHIALRSDVGEFGNHKLEREKSKVDELVSTGLRLEDLARTTG